MGDVVTEASWRSWMLLAAAVYVVTGGAYFYRFILLGEGSGFLFGVIIFLVGLGSFCVVAGLVLVPKKLWLKMRVKFRRLFRR